MLFALSLSATSEAHFEPRRALTVIIKVGLAYQSIPSITSMALQAEETLLLTEWCKRHIQAVFEAETEEEAVSAIEDTFSKDLQATINGFTAVYAQVKTQILDLRKSGKLRVSWKGFVESGNNPCAQVGHTVQHRETAAESNLVKDGRVGAFYLIEGIRKPHPMGATDGYAEFARHKAVSAR
jgi:hypothetical protein